MNNKIVRNCDKCGNEDSINSITGLCPTCENKTEKKMKRQGLRVSIDELRKVADELYKELKEESEKLGIDVSTSQGCMISIINKEPECSDTWEIEK